MISNFENAKDHISKLANDYKSWNNKISSDEASELYHILNIYEYAKDFDCTIKEAENKLAKEADALNELKNLKADLIENPIGVMYCIDGHTTSDIQNLVAFIMTKSREEYLKRIDKKIYELQRVKEKRCFHDEISEFIEGANKQWENRDS